MIIPNSCMIMQYSFHLRERSRWIVFNLHQRTRRTGITVIQYQVNNNMWGGMGKGTYRVTQSNLRFFTFLVLWAMISALEDDLFIGHKNLANICKIFKRIFLKTILEYYIYVTVLSALLRVYIMIFLWVSFCPFSSIIITVFILIKRKI